MVQPNSLIVLLFSSFLLFFVVTANESPLERSEGTAEALTHHYKKVELSSLLSSNICSPSAQSEKNKGSLKVVHKHGPCSQFSQDIAKPLTVEEILNNDQSRVNSIRLRLTTTGKKYIKTSKTTIPTKLGTMFNSGNYLVTVGLGNPRKDQTVIMDTGSDLTWIQCQPCTVSCYKQQEPIFTPSLSTTYSNISCTSSECALLSSATGNLPRCRSSACVYGIEYGDGSFSSGYFAKEKLTLSENDVIDGIMVGCGQYNEGDFGTANGLMGLGKGMLSIVSQTANQYGKVFSYCLPSTDSSNGFLTFGTNQIPGNVMYTPLYTSRESSTFYNAHLNAINVGGTPIAMSSSMMMIMDSGTVVTRVPSTTYSALSKAFRAHMAQYPMTRPLSILDTCYDLSNFTDVRIPKISMLYDGNVPVEMPLPGILVAASAHQVCLPFAGDDSGPGILGNMQQQTMQVVYDVGRGKVGFGPGGCS